MRSARPVHAPNCLSLSVSLSLSLPVFVHVFAIQISALLPKKKKKKKLLRLGVMQPWHYWKFTVDRKRNKRPSPPRRRD